MMDPEICYKCKTKAKQNWIVKDLVWWTCPHIDATPPIMITGLTRTIHVYDEPPPDCLHKFEHAVAEGMLTEAENQKPIKRRK